MVVTKQFLNNKIFLQKSIPTLFTISSSQEETC